MLKEEDIRPLDLVKLQHGYVKEDIRWLQERKNEFIETACVACNSEDYQLMYQKNGFSYVKCKQCETLFMNPRPSLKNLNDFYRNSKNYKFWSKYIFPETENARRKNIVKPRVDRIIEICKKHNIDTDTIVEIGSAYGSFCEEMMERNKFKNVIAVEPTPDLAAICRKKGLKVIESMVELIPEEELKANVIVNFEVIEHLFDPRNFLLSMKKNIKNGGLLILSCPNGEGFEMMEMGVESTTLDHEHLNYFNTKSLPILMETIGFEILEVLTPGVLDADIVRKGLINQQVKEDLFLKKILVDAWGEYGDNFQKFLQDNLLSTHMWIVARIALVD